MTTPLFEMVMYRNLQDYVANGEPEYLMAYPRLAISESVVTLIIIVPNIGIRETNSSFGTDYDQWQPYPFSGTYTPTVTGVENVAGATAAQSFWIRRGNIVQVHGSVNVQATGPGTTSFRLTLPVPCDLVAATDLAGHGPGTSFSAASGTDTAEGTFAASGAGTVTVSYSFAYEVK